MSITFTSDCPGEDHEKVSPCLCAQQCAAFLDAMDGDLSEAVRAELRSAALESCPFCLGSGVETVTESDRPSINFSNTNAFVLLRLLGLGAEPCGEVSIAEARRALLRARNTADLSSYERRGKVLYGQPRATDERVIELRPLRYFDPGLSREDLEDRIERFAQFVEASVARKATKICWD